MSFQIKKLRSFFVRTTVTKFKKLESVREKLNFCSCFAAHDEIKQKQQMKA